ncbi:hypothetical protein F3J38_04790 [Pantoea sp. Acro-805]|jgi:hypothetical protein|uniref:Uncharacterized protein n=1 Tax=Candidatus Pantoea formicae TaxID=2608355 RepID=A0ABX0QW93_9GAMM|nr:hypothetical protein [Pantoea formicae]MDF7650111.1 hypothetical protein [Erwiniaceae bacterium L1_54_3]NIE99395.1 hypothetical protein [Pantoea formicae]
MIKAYITKYALTRGIYIAEGELKNDGEIFVQQRDREYNFEQFFKKKEFQLTEEEALARADKMRATQLKKLAKEYQKLSELEFVIKR